jgi:hypothetical protein
MRFSLEDTARIQRHVRVAIAQGKLSVSQAFDITSEVMDRQFQPEHRSGHHVNERNELVPIRGAITGYVDGKPVIARPLESEPEPRRRKLHAVSIESLCEVDGRVDEIDTHDEVQELLPPKPIPIAGVDDLDEQELESDTAVEDEDEDDENTDNPD